jgi:hypothetical protein
MVVQIFQSLRATIAFHISTPCIHSPNSISDFAADEVFVLRLAEAERDIGL